LRRHIDELRGEFDRTPANARIWIGQTQLVFHPSRSAAERGDGEIVLREQLAQFGTFTAPAS
jgi:hypothetical protein